MPDVYKNDNNLLFVGQDWLTTLKEDAQKSSNHRSRLCLHTSGEDLVQEMIIAFCKEASAPVHRSLSNSESLQVLEGEVLLALFDESGNITDRIEMGALGSGKIFMYRIGSVPWHVIIAKSDIVVIHEALQGPFAKVDNPTPSWVPKDAAEYQGFLNSIINNEV
jgi:cupin fold WbuC family metalloprotein